MKQKSWRSLGGDRGYAAALLPRQTTERSADCFECLDLLILAVHWIAADCASSDPLTGRPVRGHVCGRCQLISLSIACSGLAGSVIVMNAYAVVPPAPDECKTRCQAFSGPSALGFLPSGWRLRTSRRVYSVPHKPCTVPMRLSVVRTWRRELKSCAWLNRCRTCRGDHLHRSHHIIKRGRTENPTKTFWIWLGESKLSGHPVHYRRRKPSVRPPSVSIPGPSPGVLISLVQAEVVDSC